MKGLWAPLILWLSLEAGARAQRTREDGRCGEGFLAEDGLPAECQYIEPYPTCCMGNNHCGWICDDGKTICVFFFFALSQLRLSWYQRYHQFSYCVLIFVISHLLLFRVLKCRISVYMLR